MTTGNMVRERQTLNFRKLVDVIRQVHDQLSAQASKAVNISVTIRNWLIGCYIREYEQNGLDRARYGEITCKPFRTVDARWN